MSHVIHGNHAMNHEDYAKKIAAMLSSRHYGMIMTMFRHDYDIIVTRSWHGSHIFATREELRD